MVIYINKETLTMVECPRCGGDSTKFGLVPSVKAGKMQRRRCKECGHTFYEKNGRENKT